MYELYNSYVKRYVRNKKKIHIVSGILTIYHLINKFSIFVRICKIIKFAYVK